LARRCTVIFTSLTSSHHRVRLLPHGHFRGNQRAHFHHARDRPDLPETLSVRASGLFPLGDVGDINSRPYNIFEARASLDQRRLDVLDGLHRLRSQVTHTHNLSIRPRRGSSRHGNDVAHPDRPRVAYDGLPRRTARNILTRHAGLSFSEIIERIIYSLRV